MRRVCGGQVRATGVFCGKRQKVSVPEDVGGTQAVAGLAACAWWEGTSGTAIRDSRETACYRRQTRSVLHLVVPNARLIAHVLKSRVDLPH